MSRSSHEPEHDLHRVNTVSSFLFKKVVLPNECTLYGNNFYIITHIGLKSAVSKTERRMDLAWGTSRSLLLPLHCSAVLSPKPLPAEEAGVNVVTQSLVAKFCFYP